MLKPEIDELLCYLLMFFNKRKDDWRRLANVILFIFCTCSYLPTEIYVVDVKMEEKKITHKYC